ncbi:MAG: formyltransferase family protein [Candidatus Velthaea sp.]
MEGAGPVYEGVVAVCRSRGYTVVDDAAAAAALFVLANVQRIVPAAEFSAPSLGTLCFHPSLLPRHRGRDAVYWQVKKGDSETGVTWFWVTDKVDAGPIAVQRRIAMPAGLGPRELYEAHLAPLGVRAFADVLQHMESGDIPRTAQDETLATFEYARETLRKGVPS